MTTWGEIMEEPENRSWTDCLTPGELAGGPSPHGNSWYSVFEQCPYRWWVAFKKRMRPAARSEALEVGGLYHECRARYYNKYLELRDSDSVSDEALDEACEQAMFELVERAADVVPGIAGEVRRLLRGWLTVYGPSTKQDDRHLTILVEQLIETNEGWPYSTRLDRVIWDEDLGGAVIMETKTAGRLTAELLAGYTMDSQFLGQQYCWRHSPLYQKYGPLKGFIVDLTVKTREMRFSREQVPIVKSAIRDWERQRRNTYRNMLLCEADGYWPRVRTNCVQYARRCPLTDHCAVLGKGHVKFPGFIKKEPGEY